MPQHLNYQLAAAVVIAGLALICVALLLQRLRLTSSVAGLRESLDRARADVSRHVRLEARLRTLFEDAPEGVVLLDDHHVVIESNQSFAAMVGVGVQELCGTRFDRFVAAHDQPIVKQAIDQGAGSPTEFRVSGPEAEVFAEIRASHLPLDGRNVRVLAVYDVTAARNARVKLEELVSIRSDQLENTNTALAEVQEWFREMAERSDDAFWMTDWRSRRELYVSPGYSRVWRNSTQSLYEDALSWSYNVLPEDRAWVVDRFERSTNGGQPFEAEYRIVWPDGQIRWVHDRAFPIRDDSGRVCRVAGLSKDVTDKKRAEQAASKQEERMRVMANALPVLIAHVDADGRYQFCNAAHERFFGLQQEDLLGQPFETPFRAQFDAVHERYLADALSGKQGSFESPLVDTEGIVHQVQYTYTPLVRSDGPGDGFFAIMVDVSEERKAQDALRQSEQKLHSICQAAPVGMFLLDSDGLNTFANDPLLRLSGLTLEETLGRGWLKCVHPDDVELAASRFQASQHSVGQMSITFRLIDARKRVRRVHVQTAPIFGTWGELAGKVGTVTDITDRVQTDEALRASEQRLRAILDNTTALIYLKDLEGKYQLINRQFEDLLHQRQEFVLGKPDYDLFEHDCADRFRANDRAVLHAGKACEFEDVVAQNDGEHTYISIKYPLFDDDGEIFAIGGISTDITERKRAADALRESEQYNRTLFDSCATGLALWRNDGTLVDVNPAFAQIMGLEVSEALNMNSWDITPSRFHAFEQAQLETLSRSGYLGPFEKELIHRDGHCIPVRVSGRYLERNGDRFVWTTVEDVSERVRAEEAARLRREELLHVARVSMLGEMAAAMAHEVSQPLAAIVNYVQGSVRRIRNGRSDMEGILPALEEVSKQAERAGKILRQMRSFVRKQKPQRTNVDLNIIVNEALDFAKPETEQAGITTHLNFEDALPSVYVDSLQIQQVIQNLVRNAVESMLHADRETRLLIVQTRRTSDGFVKVDIQDNGQAVSQDFVNQAFEPFFTTKATGTGMGLPICRTLIEAHEGLLTATANDLGGMTFSFKIPVFSENHRAM